MEGESKLGNHQGREGGSDGPSAGMELMPITPPPPPPPIRTSLLRRRRDEEKSHCTRLTTAPGGGTLGEIAMWQVVTIPYPTLPEKGGAIIITALCPIPAD